MKFYTPFVLLAVGAQAAVVTQVVHITQYMYEDVHVFVDANNNPISTSVEYVATTVPQTSSIPVITSTIEPASPSATGHTHSNDAGAYQIIVSSSEPAPTPSSTEAPSPETTETPSSTEAPAPTTEAPAPTTTEAPAPTTTEAPTTEAPAPATTSEAPAPAPSTAASESSDSGSGSGSSGSYDYTGEATYYAVGLGACGTTNSDDELVVALNAPQFGTLSNGNPVCGSKINIHRADNGKTVSVTVVDKCPGCAHGDLDLSPAAFHAIADEAEGRVEIEWSFA